MERERVGLPAESGGDRSPDREPCGRTSGPNAGGTKYAAASKRGTLSAECYQPIPWTGEPCSWLHRRHHRRLAPQPAVPSPQPPQATGDLTAATLKMVLSLGGILGLLVLGGYVIRRFWLDQTFLGKRTPMMRVLARVNITPKAGVALLEVPGKVLVIGLTGSTMVALGELTTATIQPLEHPPVETPSSFASTLDTSTGSFVEEEKGADALLKVSEAIQQKMRRLKQL